MLISLHAHTLPNLIVFMELTIVLPSLDTFTLTMGSTVFLVIIVPRVRMNCQLKAQDGCKG